MQKIVPNGSALIPDSATCAYEGDIFSVYTWPQAMFDGSTKQFEMLKRPDTVQVIIVKDDQILLVNDEQPGRGVCTQFPGGRVDPEDANWLAAAQREAQEETGLSLSQWQLVDVQQPAAKIEWFVATYIASGITAEEAQNIDADGEKIEVIWQSFNEVRSSILSGNNAAMQHMVHLFSRATTVSELLALPEFTGQEVDR